MNTQGAVNKSSAFCPNTLDFPIKIGKMAEIDSAADHLRMHHTKQEYIIRILISRDPIFTNSKHQEEMILPGSRWSTWLTTDDWATQFSGSDQAGWRRLNADKSHTKNGKQEPDL